jgi:large subunit ribosomal protein L25
MEQDEIVIEVTKRDTIGKQVKALRREGKIPAILYGKDMESIPVVADHRITQRVVSRLTSSSLVVIDVDGKKYHTLVRDRQYNYLTGDLTHLDFLVVSLTELVRTAVSVQHEGEAPAVTDFNGIVVTGIDTIEVEGLPRDLPNRILVDISVLREIGDSIQVKDLPISSKITLLTDPQETVVSIMAPGRAEEEEEEEVIEEGLELEPELVEKRGRVGEEGEEQESE